VSFGFLSGGTGTPKVLEGFRELIDDTKLSVIANTGDDYYWNGLRISPDLDTLLYLFSDKLDTNKYWGVKDESYNALSTLRELGGETWFNVGDKDLGLHVYRQHLMKTMNFSQIIKYISKKWGILATITPMADGLIQSRIHSGDEEYHFQEYFVKYRTNIDVDFVEFKGSSPISEFAEYILKNSNKIILGPSNPITSIGPMLSMTDLRQLLEKRQKDTLAISPIVGEKAFSGPTTKLMMSHGIETSPLGVANYYKGLISILILDPSDKKYENDIKDLEIDPIYMPIELKTLEQKTNLAENLLDLF
jgi:LPPG:FO 2-phospho-L-lactate transferase